MPFSAYITCIFLSVKKRELTPKYKAKENKKRHIFIDGEL